jgi:hypothetical protein
MRILPILKILVLSGLCVSLSAQGRQLGMVVGIDQYPSVNPLRGAVNDAKLLADAMRARGIDLPDSRVLLNEQATVANFKQTWEQVLHEAKPGDQILLSFAGHGAQEEEFDEPFDEKDITPGRPHGKDETLVFYDFDPKNPQRGRLSDDELYELFGKAKAYSVLFVADSCHSGGITRAAFSLSALPKRGGLDIYQPNPPAQERIIPNADDSQLLENVTYLAATENEALEVPEIMGPDTQPHGALSWAFTQALSGAADQNQDGLLSRRELEDYLKSQVPRLTENRQEPGLMARGVSREAPVLTSGEASNSEHESPPSPQLTELPIKVVGGELPPSITGARVVPLDPLDVAEQLCRKAADAQNAKGYLCLADMYNPNRYGRGNFQMAYEYYQLAKKYGSDEVDARLAELKQGAEAKARAGNQQAKSLLVHWTQ